MANPVKEWIQKQLYNRCFLKYEKEIAYQNNRYARFLEGKGENAKLVFKPSSFQDEAKMMQVLTGKHCVLFYQDNGILDENALAVFDQSFEHNSELIAAYCDQDYVDEDGDRHSPWFKPVWSPDTFLDSFYFGSVYAVRKNLLKDYATAITLEEAKDLLYTCLLKRIQEKGVTVSNSTKPQVARIEKILFHEFYHNDRKGMAEYEQRQNPVEDERFDLPVKASKNVCDFTFACNSEKPFVSIVIPSKDNPEVLSRCITTVCEKTQNIDYEIILIDNGSSKENMSKIQALCEQYHVLYQYEQMDFNFSKMCNIGAKLANGNYLLFLNDDMEVLESDWMSKMQQMASRKHVGAVGAKLYYPNTSIIQHAGVTNLEIGPAHKLLKDDDCLAYYHGRNRGCHDMLAVTAACLMVSKDKFEEIGGFCEDIAISYNDVDLCFVLYEKGYYNVQRNDVKLYHHESLSRGNDELSEEKWNRLLKEKKKLYDRHPDLYGVDPFYSKSLAGNFSHYICAFEYLYEKRGIDIAQKPVACKDPTPFTNGCLMIKLEQAGKQKRMDLNDPKIDYRRIEGWSYVLHNDSMRYRRLLILRRKNTSEYYKVSLNNRYRRDAQQILNGESENTALVGFYAFVNMDDLPKGIYEVGMLAKDMCSNQKLFAMTQECIAVE